MAGPPRGDAPTGSNVSPSVFGPAWMYVTCPGCHQRIRNPICRLSGVQVQAHVNRRRSGSSNEYCKVVIVVEDDFGEPRVQFVAKGESMEDIIQRETARLLRLRQARQN